MDDLDCLTLSFLMNMNIPDGKFMQALSAYTKK